MTATTDSSPSGVVIVKGGAELVDRLGPLWLALFEHHQAVAPQLGPFVTSDQSWTARQVRYRELLASPDAFVLLAERAGTAVGYALVWLRAEDDDTWVTGERVAEVETLSVLPSELYRPPVRRASSLGGMLAP